MKKTFDINIDMFDKDVFDGYYFADTELTSKAMRPSETLNNILAQLS